MKKLLVVGLSLLASSQGRFTKENKGVASNFASDSIAHVVPNPPEVSSPHVPISSCEWCKTLVPIIAERIARHHNHHGGNGNDGQMHILPVDEKEEEDGQMHILPIDEKEDGQMHILPIDEKEDGQMHILPVDEEEEEKEETEDDGQMHILPVDKMEKTGDDGQMHILPVEEEKEEEEDDGQMHILPYAENTGLHAGVVQEEEEMVNAVQSDKFRRLPSRRGPHEGRHKGKHGGKHGEKARFEICKRFDQSKECHDFLSMYGKIIAKKIMNGEQNICESLIDIIQNKDNARMCDNQSPWTAIGNGESDVSFDIFFSLLKEMSSIRPADSEVVQTTQIVQDQNGNVWQKTETFYSNSESGAWIDVVKIEQIDEPVNGGELLIHEPQQQCIFSRIKNAIVREFRNHRTFYVSFFLTFVSLYCVFSVCCKRKKCNHHECQMRQQQMEASFPEKSPLEKTPPPPAYENYPGNVYVQIGLVSPSKEKVIQRPI